LSDSNRYQAGRSAADRSGAAAGASPTAPAAKRGSPLPHHRRAGKHADEGHELSVAGGLAALSLDALSSVASRCR